MFLLESGPPTCCGDTQASHEGNEHQSPGQQDGPVAEPFDHRLELLTGFIGPRAVRGDDPEGGGGSISFVLDLVV